MRKHLDSESAQILEEKIGVEDGWKPPGETGARSGGRHVAIVSMDTDTRRLTFLQRFDLLLREGGPVPLQLPLQLKPHLRLLRVLAGGARRHAVLAL